MAFGDLVGTVKLNHSAAAVTELRATLDDTPVVGNLIVAVGMTGAAALVPMTGMSEAQAMTDGPNADEGGIHYRVVEEGDGTSWGCDSGAADEMGIVVFQIEGPFAAAPLDKTAVDGPSDGGAQPQTTGTTATTAQNDEIAIVAAMARDDKSRDLVGTATWSESFVQLGGQSAYKYKQVNAGGKVLTATGAIVSACTYGETPADDTMGCIATFMKEAAGGDPDPGVDSATLAESTVLTQAHSPTASDTATLTGTGSVSAVDVTSYTLEIVSDFV